MNKERLSIFVDESGILNEPATASRFYVLTLVLHDQDFPVDGLAAVLDRGLLSVGIANLCFHAGPIIHAKDQFEYMNWDLRRKIFSQMMGFVRRARFKYRCLAVDKKFADTPERILEKLERQLDEFVVRHKNEIDGFGDVKVYYDCGQKSITNFLHGFFASRAFRKVEFAQAVAPRKYRLFQVADLVCTLRLLELKLENGIPLSGSERRFFGGEKKFRHDILKKIKVHEIS